MELRNGNTETGKFMKDICNMLATEEFMEDTCNVRVDG